MTTTHKYKTIRRTLIIFAVGSMLGGAGAPRVWAQKKAADKDAGCAAIVFPAKGNLNPEQGTIEAVFALSYNFGDPMLKGNQSAASLFSLVGIYDSKGVRRIFRETAKKGGRDELTFGLGFSQHRGADLLGFGSSRFELPVQYGLTIRSIRLGVAAGGQPSLKAGEWHSVASTWQLVGTNYTVALYLDGKRVQGAKLPLNMDQSGVDFDSKDLLYIGDPAKTLGSLQSLRISKRARTAEEIAAADKAGLSKDTDTLLYIDGDSIAKMKADKREDLLGGKSVRAPPEGKLFGQVEFIAGRNGGKAVRFQ